MKALIHYQLGRDALPLLLFFYQLGRNALPLLLFYHAEGKTKKKKKANVNHFYFRLSLPYRSL